VTEVYSDDGTLIAEFAEERRKVVPLSEIPDIVQKAFVATEDRRFFKHKGVDWKGIARVIFLKIVHLDPDYGGGASTITQQVARTFFLSQERTYTRKIKEQILALRMERYLRKEEILFLYLNQIDLGRGLYGVGAASEYYFGKPVSKLNLAEAAMLAGIPPRPSGFNPVSNYSMARNQQLHVLKVMAQPDVGFITEEQRRQAEAAPIAIAGQSGPNRESAPHFVEHVRRLLVQRYGWEAVYRDGLKVFTTVNVRASALAAAAASGHILSAGGIDKSLGYHGPLPEGPLPGETAARSVEAEEERHRKEWLKLRWRELLNKGLAGKVTFPELEKTAPDPVPLDQDRIYRGLVEKVDDKNLQLVVRVGRQRALVLKKDMAWAAPYRKDGRPGRLRRPSDILKPGDLILVKVLGQDKDGAYLLGLEQRPAVQAGVFVMSARTGYVRALVGGQSGEYIRPIQAIRQPGSAFKPILYAAALDSDPPGRYTPATIVLDAPVIIDNQTKNDCNEQYGLRHYSPKNYDNSFTGPQSIRTAVAKSINTIAVRVGWDICVSNVIAMARKLGITSELDQLPCLPLGCSEVSLAELTTAYDTFASGGFLVEPVYILRVYDRDGNLLEYEERMSEVVYDPQIASWSEGVLPGNTLLRPDTVSGLAEEDIGAPAPANPVGRKPRHLYLARPMSPLQLQEREWKDYLAEIRAGNHNWVGSIATPVHGDPAISPQTAYLMTSMMRSVITDGTARAAAKLNRPLAGKTGTTNDYHDAWFIGFSPELIAGVWVGADDYSISLGRGQTGGHVALPIWIGFMQAALADRPPVDFPVPPGMIWAKVCDSSGLLASEYCPSTHLEVFKEGAIPAVCRHVYANTGQGSLDPAEALQQLEQ